MKFRFCLPYYKNSTRELEILDQNENIVGSLKKFNDNKLLNDIGKHISNNFVMNIRTNSFDEQDKNYLIKTTNAFELFYKMGTFSLWRNDVQIGLIREQRKLNIALNFTIKEKEYRAEKKIGQLNTIHFYSIIEDKKEYIAVAQRSLNNEVKLEVFHNNDVDYILLLAICYLHTIIA